MKKRYVKLVREVNHSIFLCEPRDDKVLPNCVVLKLLYSSYRPKRIMKKTSRALLEHKINFHRF